MRYMRRSNANNNNTDVARIDNILCNIVDQKNVASVSMVRDPALG